MLIAMTGATGFIGSHLARRLKESGHHVRALVRNSSDTHPLSELGVEIRSGEASDRSFLASCVDGCDAIINAAGRLGKQDASCEELRLANVTLVKCLLEAAQDSSVKHFIHFSTPGVVGMVGVAPECMPMRPAGAYERTKCEAENLLCSYHRHGDVPVTLLRPDFVYGPGDLHKLRMFKAIRERRFPILGGGKSLLHPTYIDDVVEGTMLVLGNPMAFGQTFNIAGPSPVTVREMVECVADDLDVRCWHVSVPTAFLKLGALGAEALCCLVRKESPVTRQQIRFFTRDHASDISKARDILGYAPKVEIREGIRRTVAWYRQEGYL